MKKVVIFLLILCMGTMVGCSSKSSSSGGKKEITVMMFEGGFGSDWVKKSADEYMKLHKEVKIKIEASPDIHQQLQPKFLSGDVPDLFNPGPSFDIQGLIASGEVLSLNKALESKAYNKKEKWLDTFNQNQFQVKMDDNYYGIPSVFSPGYVWWYDQKLFDDNGWKLPKTWEDLYKLSAEAKKKNISVFSLQGKSAGYYFYGIYLPLVERIGGIKAIEDAFNLEKGAWASEPFLKAAEESVKMMKEGLVLDGSMALSHTEAQTLFFQRKALFAMAGTWLEGEMKDVIPDDFKLRAINHPVWADGPADEQGYAPISTGWGGAWYIPKKAKNQRESIQFLKYLSSKDQVNKMVKSRGLASVVKGTEEAIQSESLKSALAITEKNKTYAPTAINDSYPEFAKNITNAYQSLLLGEMSPKKFIQYMEKKAEEVKKDDSIRKLKYDF
ncbi:extracellular solute-binding protein [Priestia koreensis]|uniref:extracellular solute-binding protein n=1 Tax=Priestia koreensis TaxID=284581 RepID=UPI00203BEFEA|nr:extracellular solute-binding protein [Priestia koreensis]MCM3005365.1 extracellular solute-binding protein [Priestia koreensis]